MHLSVRTRTLAAVVLSRAGSWAGREHEAARPERQMGPDEAMEKLVMQRALVDAVMQLGSPDREIVVLRYFEELPPRVVARRLGLSGTAVRSRLSRALGRLRQHLDASHGGQRSNWALALVGVALRPEVLAAPVVVKLGAALLGVGALALLGSMRPWEAEARAPESALWQLEEMLELRAGVMESVALPAGEAQAGQAPSVPIKREALVAVSQELAPASEAPKQRVALFMRFVDPLGKPVSGVHAVVRGAEAAEARVSDASGHVTLRADWPIASITPNDYVFVDITGPGIAEHWVRKEMFAAGEYFFGDVTVEPGGNIVGRVVDAEGLPVGGAIVLAGEPLSSLNEDERSLMVEGTRSVGSAKAWTNAEGRYELVGVKARMVSVFGRRPNGFYAFSDALAVRAGETSYVPDLIMLAGTPSQRLHGVVLDPKGEPLENARLSVATDQGLGLGRVTHSDPLGAFSFLVPDAQNYRLTVMHSDHGQLELEPVGRGQALEVRFAETRWIEVSAWDERGNPIDSGLWLRSSLRDGLGQREEGKQVGKGVAKLRIPNRRFEILVDAVGWKSVNLGPYEPAATPDRVELQLQREGMLSGRLMTKEKAQAYASVHAHRILGEGVVDVLHSGFKTRVDTKTLRNNNCDAEGRFSIELAGPGRYEMHAQLAGRARGVWSFELLDDGGRIELGDLEWRGAGSIEGRLQGSGDTSGSVVGISNADGHVQSKTLGPDGEFGFDLLLPGTWQVGVLNQRQVRGLSTGQLLPNWAAAELNQTSGWTEVEVFEGQVSSVLLKQESDLPSALQGELRLGAATTLFHSAIASNLEQAIYATVDVEGRFAASLATAGPATIEILGFYQKEVRAHLRTNLLLRPGDNYWQHAPPTATLELIGLNASAPGTQREDFSCLRYVLSRTPDELMDGARFDVEMTQSVRSRIELKQLPIGEYVLRGESTEAGVPIWKGPELLRLRLDAGDFATRDLGH